MNTLNLQSSSEEIIPAVHWGHFGIIIATLVLLAGITWMKKPEFFSFNKSISQNEIADANVPHYYPYVAPQAEPLVAGANTNQGPDVINEDGSVSPVDFGQVLGASTQDVNLSPQDVKVKNILDSENNIKNYFSDVRKIENGPIDSGAFQEALSSNNQDAINEQAKKFIIVRDGLLQMSVPTGFTKWHQLSVIQYNAAIGVLQNFTQADQNPTLVGQYLEEFIKSQQDLQTESKVVAAKYNLDAQQLSAGVMQVSQPDSSSNGASIGADASAQALNNLNGNAQ